MRHRLCGSAGLILIIYSILMNSVFSSQPYLTDEDFQRSIDDDITFLSDADFKNAEKYDQLLVDKHSNRGYLLSHQKFYHGDIRGKAQWISKMTQNGKKRNGVTNFIKKWPDGRIPYVLSTQYNDRERAVLAKAFNQYHKQTCVRFTPKEPYDRDYLYIGKIDGCYSDVGKAGGRQELSLDDGCMQYDTIIHELMHSVGFYHEHERWDRDHFISILWQNIDKGAYDQFGRVDLTESSYYGQVYDYRSIMHYDSMAFTKNGKETLVAKQPGMTKVIGIAQDFSPTDLLKIKKMYMCGNTVPSHTYKYVNTFSQKPRPTWPVSPLAVANEVSYSMSPTTSSLVPLPTSRNVMEPDVQPQCGDRSTLCWRWLERCRSPFFEKIMKEFCAQSCGYCIPPARPSWRFSEGHITPIDRGYSAYNNNDYYTQPQTQLPWYQVVG
ncbi:unnamed protein product [Bursaphelenchus xylophilus]|uniref:Metalloendopeptidase n=1 Tax=Bursaphelenchus xylophilus TaxID=6326 RepID=A0A1I7S475_BURXY|nr:unnamed protein product [Bursaphelenchus xylophilus]CAG9116801.1 unnamed protein product [Bursaphelenchus xylophilus]